MILLVFSPVKENCDRYTAVKYFNEQYPSYRRYAEPSHALGYLATVAVGIVWFELLLYPIEPQWFTLIADIILSALMGTPQAMARARKPRSQANGDDRPPVSALGWSISGFADRRDV
jgi:hypothetical protein